jgi:site-specific DNA-methyltransferase (adenine-specific)
MFEKVTIGQATLYRGDAMQVLPKIGVIADALITDPPYSSGGAVRGDRMSPPSRKYVSSKATGATHNQEFTGDNRDARSWAFWMTLWLSLARQQLKPGAYALCFTDWRQLPLLTDAFQAGGLLWRGVVPWDKTESSRAPHTGYFRHQCEYVVWGSNGPMPISRHGGPWPGCVRQRVVPSEKRHMTGKPVALMADLVKCVTPGGLVLDPFMGSASTGVAAVRSGRRFVGIECDQGAFDVACERMEEEVRGVA